MPCNSESAERQNDVVGASTGVGPFPPSSWGMMDGLPPRSFCDFWVKRGSEGDDDGCQESEREEEENATQGTAASDGGVETGTCGEMTEARRTDTDEER
ncbi:hypothetical protein NDU88_001538 [Pleurodeles waltl]|uniref:Uncharacterized protein n=1 Tax=Pleurodeles waltl TaxID=8319 RepID=A0AAV7VZ92_PLEWA|nr:hypothetical protein NDU88_001538 [Pleurodeles waltl]